MGILIVPQFEKLATESLREKGSRREQEKLKALSNGG